MDLRWRRTVERSEEVHISASNDVTQPPPAHVSTAPYFNSSLFSQGLPDNIFTVRPSQGSSMIITSKVIMSFPQSDAALLRSPLGDWGVG